MNDNLFHHININKEFTNVPNGLAEDASAECERYDRIIDQCYQMSPCGKGLGRFIETDMSVAADSQKLKI